MVSRMNPWLVELTVVRNGAYTAAERRSLSRDVERQLLHRVRQGVYVPRAAWDAGEGWERESARHILRARAFDAVAPERPVFSHWTAGAIHGLSMVDERFDRVHVTAADDRRRGIDGVSLHAFPYTWQEVVVVEGLLVTSIPRTVVDVAGASAFDGGVVIADSALTNGLPRHLLEQAVDLAGPRRASARVDDAVAFASPGGESAAESETRTSMFRLGIEPQELQHEVRDQRGLAGVADTYDRRRRIATEVDGERKYLDPRMARDGTGRALVQEKRREDRMRLGLTALGRFGYREARSPSLLRPILLRIGLLPAPHPPTLADWAAEARTHIPRRRPAPRRWTTGGPQ